jgi:hypothetical protein
MFTIPQCHIGGMKEVYVFDNNKTTNNKSSAFLHIPSKKMVFIRIDFFMMFGFVRCNFKIVRRTPCNSLYYVSLILQPLGFLQG